MGRKTFYRGTSIKRGDFLWIKKMPLRKTSRVFFKKCLYIFWILLEKFQCERYDATTKSRDLYKWKRPCREIFQDQLRLNILFWEDICWEVQIWKKSDLKTWINNAIEALIPFREYYQGLVKQHVSLVVGVPIWGRKRISKRRNFLWSKENNVRGTFSEPFEILFVF